MRLDLSPCSSQYIRTVLVELTKSKEEGGKGWRGIVVNSRGCANGPLSTAKLYQ